MKVLASVQLVQLHIQNKQQHRGAATTGNKFSSVGKERATNSALYLLNNLRSWVAPNIKRTIVLPGKNESQYPYSVSKVMHNINKTFLKCICWKSLSFQKASLRCPAALQEGCESVGTGSCRWRPESSWKTSFLGLQFNSVIRWLPLAGVCLPGIYYTRNSMVIAVLGAGRRGYVFCR